jgi:hypothetical protein
MQSMSMKRMGSTALAVLVLVCLASQAAAVKPITDWEDAL